MTVLLPLLVAVVGVLMYALATSPKVQEMGRIAYFAGLLAFLLTAGDSVVQLFSR